MTEAEINAMKEENEALKKENAEFKDSNTKLGEDLKLRDTQIADLKTQAGERAQQFKKLKDMTDAERDSLTEKEQELMMRQEKIEEDRANEIKERVERETKQRTETIESLANKFAKGDKDVAAQIKINLGKFNPELLNKALTETEIAPFVDSAFKMTGITSTPDPLRTAHNADGGNGPINSDNDFSKTESGKSLASAMGLSQATPEGAKAVESAS